MNLQLYTRSNYESKIEVNVMKLDLKFRRKKKSDQEVNRVRRTIKFMKKSKYNIIIRNEDSIQIYNTVSKGILKLDKGFTKKFDEFNDENHGNNLDLFNNLVKGNMLVEDDVDEIERIKFLNSISRFSQDTLSLTIAPTSDCNFACSYCYEKGIKSHSMNEEVINDIIKFVENKSKNIKYLSVTWYGGEPLLEIGVIQKLSNSFIDISKSNNIKYFSSIVTNGYYLTKEIASELVNLNVSYVQITIDGNKDSHNERRILKDGGKTFDTIIQNVIESMKIIKINIRMNVDRKNVGESYDLINILKEKDALESTSMYLAMVDNINENYCNEDCLSIADFSKKEIEFYHKAIDDGVQINGVPNTNYSICGAVAINSFIIDPKGDLYKCWNTIGLEDECVGSVKKGVRLDYKFTKWVNYNPLDDQACSACNILPICMGGCPYTKIKLAKRNCKSLKYSTKEYIELWNKIL